MENAWPSTFELGSLKAGSSEPLIEQVTIVSERLHRME